MARGDAVRHEYALGGQQRWELPGSGEGWLWRGGVWPAILGRGAGTVAVKGLSRQLEIQGSFFRREALRSQRENL